jgi:hypothetical protein
MVTSSDLVGAVMQVSVTSERVMRRDGRQFPSRYQTDWTIEFISEDTIRVTFLGTDTGPRGINKSPLEGGTVNLGSPNKTVTRGGGDQVWLFSDGALSYLRTYEGGGMKGTFSVTRTGETFVCNANVSWPREVGVPTIVMRSFVDNAKIEIISAKQSTSSCKINIPARATKRVN